MWPRQGRSLGGEKSSPLRYSGLGESHGQRSLEGYGPWGCTELAEHIHKARRPPPSTKAWLLSEPRPLSTGGGQLKKVCAHTLPFTLPSRGLWGWPEKAVPPPGTQNPGDQGSASQAEAGEGGLLVRGSQPVLGLAQCISRQQVS